MLFLLILLAVVLPLSLSYYQDSRDYEIQVLASKLDFFAERGTSYLGVEGIHALRTPADMRTPDYKDLLKTLNRIKKEFIVDNAIIMRRQPSGKYVFVAAGHGGFKIGQPVHIHKIFPGTFKGTNDTWNSGRIMHSQLFGKEQGFDQFLQINAPLKLNGKVVAILMLNKFANPVDKAVMEKTTWLISLTAAILIAGFALFGFLSARMLRLLGVLTRAADEVSEGNLDVAIPEPKSRDEVGRLAASFRHMIEGLKQRDFIRDTFGRYVSQEVVDELLTSPDSLRLGGELREITLLVSDLRGFTAMSSRLEPQDVIEIINGYLEHMIDTITRFGGTVDEFQGDGILAFFGAPIEAEDGPDRAVACAIEMQNAMEAVNAGQHRRNLPDLKMGIGINTGEVIIGNIGSEKRKKYSAIGTTINTAYRIESYTVGAQILISPTTHEQIKDIVDTQGTIDVQFKGLDRPVTVLDVAGIRGKFACRIPEKAPEVFVTLSSPLPVHFYALEEKTVSENAIAGKIL